MNLLNLMTNFNDKMPPENVPLLIANIDGDLNYEFEFGFFYKTGSKISQFKQVACNKPNVAPVTAYYIYLGNNEDRENWIADRSVFDSKYIVLEENKGR